MKAKGSTDARTIPPPRSPTRNDKCRKTCLLSCNTSVRPHFPRKRRSSLDKSRAVAIGAVRPFLNGRPRASKLMASVRRRYRIVVRPYQSQPTPEIIKSDLGESFREGVAENARRGMKKRPRKRRREIDDPIKPFWWSLENCITRERKRPF